MDRYQQQAWCDSMRIKVDFSLMMSTYIGNQGLSETELEANGGLYAKAAANMHFKRGSMQWRELPFNQAEVVEEILATAAQVRENFDNFVLLGIGGSALGPIALQAALSHLRYNELPKARRGGPKLYVEDNIDPERMASLLDVVDVERTVFNVITKSGSTSETMAQLLLFTDLLRARVGDSWPEHIIATTDREKGNLIKIAKAHNLKTFYIPSGVGGRFSVLSPVGLLSAAVCGIDIRELLAGAAYMDALCDNPNIWHNPAYMLASLELLAVDKGCNIGVLMPYSDSLKYFSDWYGQLWAESLGKRVDNHGNTVHTGQTPVKALGATDQHSQLQLYTEGPFDKVVTFLAVERYRTDITIPRAYEDLPDVDFLSGHTFGKLIQSELYATRYALQKSGRMSKTITLPEVNPFTIGQLIVLFALQTAFAGELLDINAFDQPGVEEGKNATYALLGKPGFAQKCAELESEAVTGEKYIL